MIQRDMIGYESSKSTPCEPIAMVNIPLKEVEELKASIEKLKTKVQQWKAKTDYTLTISVDINSWADPSIVEGSSYWCMTYGNIELLQADAHWKEIQGVGLKAFTEMIENSVVVKFYRKFPKWVHKLMKCEQRD